MPAGLDERALGPALDYATTQLLRGTPYLSDRRYAEPNVRLLRGKTVPERPEWVEVAS